MTGSYAVSCKFNPKKCNIPPQHNQTILLLPPTSKTTQLGSKIVTIKQYHSQKL